MSDNVVEISSDGSENERQLEIEDADNYFADRGDGANEREA